MISGDDDAASDPNTEILNMQIAIIQATAPFGPVAALVPDGQTKAVLSNQCRQFGICEFLKSDRLRLLIVQHEGVWIRDFGPQIESSFDTARVVHWRYFDSRAHDGLEQQREEINRLRLSLLEVKLKTKTSNSLLSEADDSEEESPKEADSTKELDSKIAALHELSSLLKDNSFLERGIDDRAGLEIADAVLDSPNFKFIESKISVDGGNLIKLPDGRCLTSRVLLTRNKDQYTDVTQALKELGGCGDVVYLDPLPGPVIEHVDMFVLPE
jgi:hypothetical protein